MPETPLDTGNSRDDKMHQVYISPRSWYKKRS